MDGDGGLVNTSANVSVKEANQPPSISDIPNPFVRYETPFEIDLEDKISDPDTPKDELIITLSDNINATINGYILILNYSIDALNQNLPLTIFVSDGIFDIPKSINVTVSDNFPPEILQDLPDITFDESDGSGGSFNVFDLDDYFDDPEGEILS